MLSKLSYEARRNALLAVTALIVAYVRTYLQYHEYGWTALGGFLSSWLVHYIALAMFVGLSGVFATRFAPTFFDQKFHQKPNDDELKVYLTLVILIGAIALFVLAHWPASGALDFAD